MDARLSSTLLALIGAALAGCAGAEPDRRPFGITDSAGVTLVRNPAELADSSRAPRLTPDLRIGVVEGAVEYQFSQIVSVDEGSGGEIYVLDREAFNVRVYDADGSYLRTIGRQGEGPGEFRRPEALRVGAGDTVYVVENQFFSGWIHAFAPDGTPVRTNAFQVPGNIGAQWDVTRQGDVLLEILRTSDGLPNLLVRVDGATTAVDTLAVLHPVRPENLVIFGTAPHWTALADGGFVLGRSDEYRLVVSSADGAVERVVTRDVTGRPIPESVKADLLESRREAMNRPPPPSASPAAAERLAESNRRMLEGMTVADHYPIQVNVTAGPRGTLWAQRFLPPDQGSNPEGMQTYDVFDAEGRLLGSARMPSSFPRPWFRSEHIYQVVRDELGVQYLQRLRVDWRDGG